jgi:hypothetical protein
MFIEVDENAPRQFREQLQPVTSATAGTSANSGKHDLRWRSTFKQTPKARRCVATVRL